MTDHGPYTPQEDAQIIALLKQNVSHGQIARRLSRGKSSVTNRIHYAGLADKDEVPEIEAEGMTACGLRWALNAQGVRMPFVAAVMRPMP